jgi:undecaprenyl-diphosphatase
MTFINSTIIFTASYLYLFGLAIALVYFLLQSRGRQIRMAMYGILLGFLTFALSRLVAPFYYDPRPFVVGHFTPLIAHAVDNGFPSDHVLLMSAVTLALIPYNKRLAWLLGVLTVLIGTARVLAGVHHVVDIVGAMAIAIISAVFVFYVVMPKIIKKEIH